MGLEMKVKRAILKELACKYQRSSKKGKGQVLEEFLECSEPRKARHFFSL